MYMLLITALVLFVASMATYSAVPTRRAEFVSIIGVATALGIVVGVIWGCHTIPQPAATSAPAPAPTVDQRINPSPEMITKLQDHQQTATDQELSTNCHFAETPNGFNYTCGPAYVEPTDCNDGFVKVCVRRYGDRTCGCYPSGEEQ